MNLRRFMTDVRAVSPIIATVMLIAVTVAIAGVVMFVSQTIADENTPTNNAADVTWSVKDAKAAMTSSCGNNILEFTPGATVNLRDYQLLVGDPDGGMQVVWDGGNGNQQMDSTLETGAYGLYKAEYGGGGTTYTPMQPADSDDEVQGGHTFFFKEGKTACSPQLGSTDTIQVRLIHVASSRVAIDTQVRVT